MQLDPIADLDAGRIAVKGVPLCVAGLKLKSVRARDDAALQHVMAVVDRHRRYHHHGSDGGAHANSSTDNLAIAGTD